MSCRKAATAATYEKQRASHDVYTKHRRGAFHMPPLYGISPQQCGDEKAPLSDVDAMRQQGVVRYAAGRERATEKSVFVLDTNHPTLGATTI